MAGINQLTIKLLGTSISIRSREEQDYLNRVLQYLENKVEETKKQVKIDDPLKIAILTNVYIIDELFRAEGQDDHDSSIPETESEEMERITLKMITDIDELIGM